MARPKGSKNKLPMTVKENFLAVFTRLGGTAAMARWAVANQNEFYALYARLLPKEIEASVKTVTELTIADALTLKDRLAEQLDRRQADSPEPSVQ